MERGTANHLSAGFGAEQRGDGAIVGANDAPQTRVEECLLRRPVGGLLVAPVRVRV